MNNHDVVLCFLYVSYPISIEVKQNRFGSKSKGSKNIRNKTKRIKKNKKRSIYIKNS